MLLYTKHTVKGSKLLKGVLLEALFDIYLKNIYIRCFIWVQHWSCTAAGTETWGSRMGYWVVVVMWCSTTMQFSSSWSVVVQDAALQGLGLLQFLSELLSPASESRRKRFWDEPVSTCPHRACRWNCGSLWSSPSSSTSSSSASLKTWKGNHSVNCCFL